MIAKEILTHRRAGAAVGVYSVCSANARGLLGQFLPDICPPDECRSDPALIVLKKIDRVLRSYAAACSLARTTHEH